MTKKNSTRTPLEKRYLQITPKPLFPLETYKMILALGIKEGEYPKLWRDRKPNIQQFMRSLHPNCEICGVDQAKFSHDVHHLKWDKKHDCRYENLIVICRGCHSRIHRRGWIPSEPWNITEWGQVPQGLIDRGHLDQDGNAIALKISDNKSKSSYGASGECKGKETQRSRYNSQVSAPK